jgi:hypothetical protein
MSWRYTDALTASINAVFVVDLVIRNEPLESEMVGISGVEAGPTIVNRSMITFPNVI